MQDSGTIAIELAFHPTELALIRRMVIEYGLGTVCDCGSPDHTAVREVFETIKRRIDDVIPSDEYMSVMMQKYTSAGLHPKEFQQDIEELIKHGSWREGGKL